MINKNILKDVMENFVVAKKKFLENIQCVQACVAEANVLF